ncbi:MAG: SDR family oxidoreductase [Rikenellaceae bacterium]
MRDKTIFITGGASGIGRGLVEHFAAAGAIVAFCDIDEMQGVIAAEQTGATFYKADVCDEKRLTEVLEDITSKFGGIDVIINNAGVSKFTPLTEIEIEEFDKIIATNLRPVFVTSRFMARSRNTAESKQKYGRIINIASTRHLQSEPHSEAYAATKGGIVSLTHALAISLSECNITVNCISPGWIDTGHYPISEAGKRQHPSGRVGTPYDIARMCEYLCREENDFINGQNLVIDGGMTKKMIYLE